MAATDITDLRLGLCGWNGSQRAYFEDFDCIEIQSTFYDPPSVQVAHKWRSAAPVDFQFCMKAWQLITHTAASPTYRRLRSPLAANDRDAVGSFRQTKQVWQALSIAAKNEAILAGEKEPWCGLRDGLLQG
jgi:uncharacterized protein YecE (DUF72 family)